MQHALCLSNALALDSVTRFCTPFAGFSGDAGYTEVPAVLSAPPRPGSPGTSGTKRHHRGPCTFKDKKQLARTFLYILSRVIRANRVQSGFRCGGPPAWPAISASLRLRPQGRSVTTARARQPHTSRRKRRKCSLHTKRDTHAPTPNIHAPWPVHVGRTRA